MAASPSGSPMASPKVDDRFESHGGFALHQGVYCLHPVESWIKGTISDIKAIAKRGGFAEVCFGVTPTLDPVHCPALATATTLFPLREAEIHAIVSDSSSGGNAPGGEDDLSEEARALSGDTVNDLLQLSYLHDSTLLDQVRQRYFKNLMYTHIGPILLALNPYDFTLKHYVDNNQPKYIAEGDAVVSKPSKLLPHAWTTAHYSYWLMTTDRENQGVIVSGESGAGKTETAKIVVKYLGKVSTASVSDSARASAEQVTIRVNLTSPILEAFGNAKTRMNDNSSRFGKFMKVHFSNELRGSNGGGVMTGAAMEVYLLEKSRIVTHGEGERSYHCFYQVLSEGGACKPEETQRKKALKMQLELKQATDVPSLSIGNATKIPGVDDAVDFEEVMNSMVAVGLEDDERSAVWQVVGGILHLLQFQFADTTTDASEIDKKCSSHVDAVKKLLLIDVDTLAREFCTTTNITRGEKFVKTLRRNVANDLRDALAKSLYEALFLWLVFKINNLIRPDDDHSDHQWIGLLDIFGFENFAHGNSFEQMCINLANETLQNHYNSIIFTRDMEECRAEGIDTASVTFYDNQPCLDLVCGVNFSNCGPRGTAVVTNKMSIMHLIDESCSLQTGSDAALVAKIVEVYGGKQDGSGSHANFSKPKTQNNAFNIIHYAGEVKYTIDGFRSKNADTLKETLKDVLRESTNTFIASLLGAPAASPTSASSSGPATKRTSVGSFFRTQLISLMTEINSTHPHWIRCVKPHSAKKPRMFHGTEVMTQLRCAGVLETVQIRQRSFSIRLPFEEFVERYRNLLRGQTLGTIDQLIQVIIPAENIAGRDTKESLSVALRTSFTIDKENLPVACKEILRRSGISKPELAQVGKTKVFLRTNAFHVLSQVMRAVKSSLITTIQAYAVAYRSGIKVRCLELNRKVKLITSFLMFRPSHAVFRKLELRERERELLTRFRNLMILQGDECTQRTQLEAQREKELVELDEARKAHLVQLRVEWEARREITEKKQREDAVLTESQKRDVLVHQESTLRGLLWGIFSVDSDEETTRKALILDEEKNRMSTLHSQRERVLEALAQFYTQQLLERLSGTVATESSERDAIRLTEEKEFQLFKPIVTLAFQEAKARALLISREASRFLEFPELMRKQLEDLRRQWDQRKGMKDRYTLLLLQREEQEARAHVQSDWEQELVLVIEDVNEDEVRALNDQYEREAAEERDRLIVEIEARQLQEHEEQQKFEELRRSAQSMWMVAEAERRLDRAIRDEEKTISDLKCQQVSLTKQLMEECRRREIAGSTLNSSRDANGTRAKMVNAIAKSAEKLRHRQVLLTMELHAHEDSLASLRFEQSLPKQPASHVVATAVGNQTSLAAAAGLTQSRSASELRVQEFRDSLSRPRSASPNGGQSVDGNTTHNIGLTSGAGKPIHHTTTLLRQASAHCGSSMELLERLSVIRACAASSNYASDPQMRLVARGDDELIPEYNNEALTQRKLERLKESRVQKQREQLTCMEQTASFSPCRSRSRGGSAEATLMSPEPAPQAVGPLSAYASWQSQFVPTLSHASSSPSIKAATYCSPKVHCGISVHWPPVPKAQQIFPKASKNPFSSSWRPVKPPAGAPPGVLYCYLPDGTLVRVHEEHSEDDDEEQQVLPPVAVIDMDDILDEESASSQKRPGDAHSPLPRGGSTACDTIVSDDLI